MGIPFYFRAVTKKYADVIIRGGSKKPLNPASRTSLFLDLNCAIHRVARDVLAASAAHEDAAVVEGRIIDETIRYIDAISTFVTHTRAVAPSLVYIAVDGLPPRAKMSQQRKRRFMSAWRNRMLASGNRNRGADGLASQFEWDSSAITPGTAFMKRLNGALRDRYGDRPGYVVSDSDEPGEGETKIFRHLREMNAPEAGAPCEEAVVYGLDADLIMLSLVALSGGEGGSRNVLLLREPVEFSGEAAAAEAFMYFDVGALKRHLPTDVPTEDYVVLCFLLGNDFVPSLSFLKINDNGIDYLLQLYARIKRQVPDTRLMRPCPKTRRPSLCYNTLLRLLSIIRDDEDELMAKADKSYYAYRPHNSGDRRASLDPAQSVNESTIDSWPLIHRFPDVIRPGAKAGGGALGTGWRERWYYHLFFGMTDSKDVASVCRDYLTGIQWTFDYYFKGAAPSQNWHYRYGGYSPTALDLCNVLATSFADGGGAELGFLQDEHDACKIEWTTELQLLAVLPACSASRLLPTEAARRVVVDEALGMTYLYPTRFQIQTYLKKYLWECSPALPPIDVAALEGALAKAKAQ
jgi:5'-3' exoribonuclease 1